jgi:hypothetical protein
MFPRTEYEMTEADLDELLDACKPVPVMMVGGHAPSSPQENANRAWVRLGEKMGFDSTTVRPADGRGTRFFTAVPSETAEARQERLAREAAEKRQQDIARLSDEIAERQHQLDVLRAEEDREG